ncbi:MAG: GAF domain-containing protein [Janthinobacterium lividum]
MPVPIPIPENEAQRLEWLRQCDIIDTLPEVAFDEVAQMAAELCRVPTAAINLVDHDRQWSKAAVGLDKKQDSRDVSFCAHTILQPDLMVVPDALGDQRFADNPLVTGEPYIRFYAGAPLVTSEGFGLGSLCVVDRVPRQLTEEQAAVLRLLARQIVGRIELSRHVALQGELITDRERLLKEVRQASEQQHVFLRDVLSSVTEGKLILCASEDDLPTPFTQFSDPVPLSATGGIRELRRITVEACAIAGLPDIRRADLETAVGEAAMNAIVHSSTGLGHVFIDDKETVQVWIEDKGKGIAVADLPNATLQREYSTAGTMGHGFKMMLTTADRVHLLTGSAGTTVVIEQDRTAPLSSW